MAVSDSIKETFAKSMRLLLRKEDFSKITTNDICEKSGLSRKTFYRYFSDKYDLLSFSFDLGFAQIVRFDERWTSWDYFPTICSEMYKDPVFYLKALQITGQNNFRDYCFEHFLFPIYHNDFSKVFAPEELEDERFLLRHCTDIFYDWFLIWLSDDPVMPPEEFVTLVKDRMGKFALVLDRITERPIIARKEEVFPGES